MVNHWDTDSHRFMMISTIKIQYHNKTLIRKHGGKFRDIRFGNAFLDIIPKAQATKSKIDKLENIKINNSYFCKEDTEMANKYMLLLFSF